MTLCDCASKLESDQGRTLDLPDGVPPLRSFYLYLSNSCNLACRHCWITPRFVDGMPDPGDVIDVSALRAAVAEAKPMGLKSAKLTGGEPMLHPGFMSIIDMLTLEDLALTMETNGTLLTADSARYLKDETNMGFISVSIDGADAETHDRFRGVTGSFDAVLRGLDCLVAAGFLNTQVIMCPHKGNVEQLDAIVQLASEHGAGSVKLNPVVNTGRGRTMHKHDECLDMDDHLALAQYVYGELRERAALDVVLCIPQALKPIRELWRSKGKTGDCGVRNILGILGTGEVALCGIGRSISDLVYGKLGRDRIRDIWLTHPTILELRRALDDISNYPGICGRCVYAKQCRTGCVASNYVDGRHLIWPDPLCVEVARRGDFLKSRMRPDGRHEGLSGC